MHSTLPYYKTHHFQSSTRLHHSYIHNSQENILSFMNIPLLASCLGDILRELPPASSLPSCPPGVSPRGTCVLTSILSQIPFITVIHAKRVMPHWLLPLPTLPSYNVHRRLSLILLFLTLLLSLVSLVDRISSSRGLRNLGNSS